MHPKGDGGKGGQTHSLPNLQSASVPFSSVEIFSMSKSYNMAGWRVGYCVGNARLIAALARIKSYLDYGVFQPIQIASIIALRECEEDTRKICAVYQQRRDVLVDGLKRAGWAVEKPRGTMFMWAPLPEQFREIGSLEFSKLLLEKAQVAVSPGIGFGPLGEGHVRFALVENEHRIRQATRSIGQFLKASGAGGQGPGIGGRPPADVIESDKVR